MRYLLDTNACIAILRGNEALFRKIQDKRHGDCVVSSIVAFELYDGAEQARHSDREQGKVERLLSLLPVVPWDARAAQQAARVRNLLKKLGTPIGPYDLQIAAHALSLEITLVTHNTKEFKRIKGLDLEDWELTKEKP